MNVVVKLFHSPRDFTGLSCISLSSLSLSNLANDATGVLECERKDHGLSAAPSGFGCVGSANRSVINTFSSRSSANRVII